MNRVIKFRAWDGKTMHYPEKTWPTVEIAFTKSGWCANAWSQGGEHLFDISIVDIQQYTGKSDNTGQEIYEGDIIEFDAREWGGSDNIHVVSWDEKEAAWSWGGGSTSDMEFRKVIGNIYENPELLQK